VESQRDPVTDDVFSSRRRLLDPVERVSEILFGLVMVLTTTCSFSVGGAGHTEVRQMLIGALGCNLAWGLIDAVMYLMARSSERGRGILALHAVRKAVDPIQANRIIAGAMPPLLASAMSPSAFESLSRTLKDLPEPSALPRWTKDDLLASVGVFLLVVGSTLPVVLPFTFVSGPTRALRVSNAIAIGLLFLSGYVFGRYSGDSPSRTGLAMVVLGSAMVGLTIALGG
jgi:VIT1/CCC1 family predicted Fe2+/Mn2+ transporter